MIFGLNSEQRRALEQQRRREEQEQGKWWFAFFPTKLNYRKAHENDGRYIWLRFYKAYPGVFRPLYIQVWPYAELP